MASKRKSSTPCMIPSKAARPTEGFQDAPIYLGSPRISEVSRNASPDLSEKGDSAEVKDGTYTCRPCTFETPDLNLFLDHVYTGHPEFRADSCFLCLTCGISSAKFEGLALHNARVHPSTLNTSLQLKIKDKRAVVEQTLLNTTESTMGKDIEIAISKTPIMRMLKGKSEAKKIAVSHTVLDEPESVLNSRETERKERTTVVNVSHVPTLVHNGTAKVMPSAIQIVNGSGALPMLKTPITQVVSVVQNKNSHHSTPASNVSSSSSASSKNLPKVMIPLSSIPTYSASMDESSFLKTSFSKFPYPTKAELCYLTVVTKFPEEQIKIWFTAQRLKQGISWSPEEIDEARRKMFNTIIQTAPASSPSLSSTAQHTIVLPASLGASGLPQILHGGVIVTQPMMANGIQVSSAPVALAVTPKPQAAARPMMQARPAAALVADKGISMVVGTVGSSSAGRNVISPSSRNGTSSVSSSSGQASVINLSLGNNRTKTNVVNGKHRNVETPNKSKGKGKDSCESRNSKSNSPVVLQNDNTDFKSKAFQGTNIDDVHSSGSNSPSIKMEDAASPASKSSSPSPAAPSISGSKTPVNPFLDPSFYKGKKSQEQLGALKDSFLVNQFPDQEEVDRLIALTGLTVREVRKWFSDRRYHLRNLKGREKEKGEKGKEKNSSGSSGTSADGANPLDLSDTGGAPDPKQGPAPQSPSASQTPTSPTTPSRRTPRVPSPDFTAIRYKERDPHQVRTLGTSFSENPDPSNEEVDRLRTETKMTRREIHSWFTDRRKRVAAEKKKQEEEQAMREEEEAEEEEEEEESEEKPKVNPIKINLKMLKVTEAKHEGETSESSPVNLQNAPSVSPGPTQSSKNSSSASKTVVSPKPTSYRGKKTPDQLHMLKKIYARTQWPSATQYDELISGTGLPRPEVVRWFGDCRYVQKNGQLKWLESYQRIVLREDLQKGDEQTLQAHLDSYGRLDESEMEDLTDASGLTPDLVKFWFSTKPSSFQLSQTEAAVSSPSEAQLQGSSSPMEPQPGAGNEEKMEQSVCGVSKDQ